MATSTTKTTTTPKKSTTAKSTTTKRSNTAQVREGLTKARNGATDYVRQGTERAVNVPVGAALTAADRVNEIVEPLTTTEGREKELKSIRTRVERELNKYERRGGTARRKATSVPARPVGDRVKSPRRELKQNRKKAEDGLKKARTNVEERVSTLV